MKLSVCITTRNRTKELDGCLQALWDSTVKPHSVVVSDDSSEETVRQQNREVVEQYLGTKYILGPQAGVCANRNNAVKAIPSSETDLVCFIDDDICVEPDFIACALERYSQMLLEESKHTIVSGISKSPDGHEMKIGKLTFRGYFAPSEIPETVAIHATVFPRIFFDKEQWDENIFFGYEDAELCLRALKQGYNIIYTPELKVLNTGFKKGTLRDKNDFRALSNYEIYIEAARLYVGIKRYKYISPKRFKLISFLTVYFIHMTFFLIRKRALKAWPLIIQRSNFGKLLLSQ